MPSTICMCSIKAHLQSSKFPTQLVTYHNYPGSEMLYVRAVTYVTHRTSPGQIQFNKVSGSTSMNHDTTNLVLQNAKPIWYDLHM